MRRKRIPSLVVAGLLALVLGVAGPAAAEPPTPDVAWFDGVAGRLAGWWSTIWGDPAPRSLGAASETAAWPNLDPDGNNGTPNLDPDGQNLGEPQPPGDASLTGSDDAPPTAGAPNLDPNG